MIDILKKVFGDNRPLNPNYGKEVVVKPEAITSTKASVATVKEIHETFYTEVDRLLEQANLKVVTKILDEPFKQRAKALSELGFSNHPHVNEYREKEAKERALEYENGMKDVLIEAIQYYTQKYPQYKFITFDSVGKICKKYGLIYAPVNYFIGEIPQKNLEHMINFRIDPLDKAVLSRWRHIMNFMDFEKQIDNPDRYTGTTYEVDERDYTEVGVYGKVHTRNVEFAPLIIAAPRKDFGDFPYGSSIDEETGALVIPQDPIVIQPVRRIYDMGGWKYQFVGGLIVTAWGDEASDEAVVNQKMN